MSNMLPLIFALFLNLGPVGAMDASQYEEKYKAKFSPKGADELVHEPLRKLAFGSCQRTYPQLREIYDVIFKYDPDLFLFTGDNFYTDTNCCDKQCVHEGYLRMVNFEPFKEFKKRVKKFDGIYDDHDYGINDGDASYPHRDFSQKVMLDFFEKPEDHYRRKRRGGYFSMSYVNPEDPEDHIKVIVLDTRYHRDCFHMCICKYCRISFLHSRAIMLRRLFNSLFGFGCDHPGDVLGPDQWSWFESQLYESTAKAHVIVSSIQVFTKCPLGESWGHLPFAKKRLLDLLEATKPRKPIFLSGDIHYAELTHKYGLVEYTSSSLTHSVRPYNNYTFFFIYPFYLVSKRFVYLYNNFGAINFNYNKGRMDWDGAVYNVSGQPFLRYRSTDEDLYRFVGERDSFFRDHKMVPCLSRLELFKRALVTVLVAAVPSLLLYLFYRWVSKSSTRRGGKGTRGRRVRKKMD